MVDRKIYKLKIYRPKPCDENSGLNHSGFKLNLQFNSIVKASTVSTYSNLKMRFANLLLMSSLQANNSF